MRTGGEGAHPRPGSPALLHSRKHPVNESPSVQGPFQLLAIKNSDKDAKGSFTKLSKVLSFGLGLHADHLCDFGLIFNLRTFISSLVTCKL